MSTNVAEQCADVSLIKYEDQLRSHPAFFKSALSAIDIYVKVSDDPSVAVEKLSEFKCLIP